MNTVLKAFLLGSVGLCLATTAFAASPMKPHAMKKAPAAPVVAPAVSDWDGFYAGFNIGIGAGLADHRPATPIGPGGLGYDLNILGLIGGGQVGGLGHISGNIVAGGQADFDISRITGTHVFTPGGSRTQTINWIATFEGRLGYDAGQFVPYLSGGLAIAQGTRTATIASTQTHSGLSIGAGVMMKLANNVSADLEYRYQAFGPRTYVSTGGTAPSVALNVSTVRVGINFHF